THRNLFRFLSSAFTSSERSAQVLRQAHASEKALARFAGSDYLTEILVRHPEEIATLAEMPEAPARISGGYLFESSFHHVRPTSDPVFAYVAGSSVSYGEELALLRQHYRHRVFAAGARNITELRDVYQSLGETTSAAEDAVTAALAIAGSPPQLAVLALGRLGTGEFDVLSDADVLFVVDEGADGATQKLFQRFATDPGFLPAIREMRAKLENAEPGEKNFKSSAGAMYDIDFLTSYLLIRHSIADKRGTVRERLRRCGGAGL